MDSLNVVFTAKNVVEVRTEPVREMPADHVLIEARASLISSGTECICLQQNFAPDTTWATWVRHPFYPGYASVGTITAVGGEVTGLKEGDRVIARANHGQRYIYPASHCIRVPDAVSDDAAIWHGLAKITQNGVRRAQHELGDAVAIVGLGPLGQLVTQYVRLAGAREVLAIDPAKQRVDSALASGATRGPAMTVDAAKDAVLELTEGRGADVVYDITGHHAVFQAALRLARKLGRFILLGDTGSPGEQRLTHDVINKGLSIIGAHDTNPPQFATDHTYWSAMNMARLFLTYIERGQMRCDDLITHRFSPTDAPDAYKTLIEKRGETMGVMFDWTKVR